MDGAGTVKPASWDAMLRGMGYYIIICRYALRVLAARVFVDNCAILYGNITRRSLEIRMQWISQYLLCVNFCSELFSKSVPDMIRHVDMSDPSEVTGRFET